MMKVNGAGHCLGHLITTVQRKGHGEVGCVLLQTYLNGNFVQDLDAMEIAQCSSPAFSQFQPYFSATHRMKEREQ